MIKRNFFSSNFISVKAPFYNLNLQGLIIREIQILSFLKCESEIVFVDEFDPWLAVLL